MPDRLVEPATNVQIKEIWARNESIARVGGRRRKTVGKADLWVEELDALLERIRVAENASPPEPTPKARDEVQAWLDKNVNVSENSGAKNST